MRQPEPMDTPLRTAFGLLVQHSQAQVMQEVADTASEVGRATLRTFTTLLAPFAPLRVGVGRQCRDRQRQERRDRTQC